ncbi:cell division protein FtsQ [Undibacterium sp. KW1]|uniref:alginate O-acetyltransferase AlgX-related protein n=1 Tax=Undibacterium sp. KW1 TaxID=2058624 RepID=UPI001331D560|nr:cell division protein FtsQ [Undibacterium sp. KW1]BBB59990.1 cell division protein FtsQ [Undibacterium sp. KW1]
MSECFSFDPKKAGWTRFIPVAAFGVIMLGGFAVTQTSLREVPEEKWEGIGKIHRLLDGEATRQFSTQLNEHFLLSKPFAKIERGVTWTIAGDTGASVRRGCDGWLFLSDELTPYAHAAENAAARARIITQTAADLQMRGIKLVVAVVPDKTRIEEDHLCGLHRPAAFANRLNDWVSTLASNKVEVLNFAPALAAMKEERYYRSDSHWNERGANVAATTLADRLQSLKLVDKPATAPDPKAIQSNTTERSGDLMRVSNLEGLPAWMRPATEVTQVSKVAPVAVASDDLFGDAGLPTVALVGTSFSRAANFVPFLSQHLGAPVANLAKDGGDFDGAAYAYLNSKEFKTQPPKVVVWEVPERMLQKTLTVSEKKWLETFKS